MLVWQKRGLSVGVFSVVAGAAGLACSSASGTGSGAFGGSGGVGGGAAAGGSGGTLGGTGGTLGGSGGSQGGSGGGSSGGIPQTCAQALAEQSYIGCEYWPTITTNSQLNAVFSFAVAIANPTNSPADVVITRGGTEVSRGQVAPGALQVAPLPWVPALKQDFQSTQGNPGSALVRGGAYKIESSVPVTVYQFNPLDYELRPPPSGCELTNGRCFSFTNDASLLLPKTVLRNDYVGLSFPTHHIGIGLSATAPPQLWTNAPGFLAITATEDGTQVNVRLAGGLRAGTGGVQQAAAGSTVSYSLNAGDVVVLASARPPDSPTPEPNKPCATQQNGARWVTLCPSSQTYDLTGSLISSDRPVQVIGGHDCTMIPFGRFACDHIEESLFPTEALGADLIVTAPHTARSGAAAGTADNMFVRVVSATDQNDISFDPPVHPPVTLQTGQWIEIGPVTQDFRVLGRNKLMVSQYMVGENFAGASVGAGDPAQSIAIPGEQYRLSYTFLAPPSYAQNYVNVIARTGTTVNIDGAPITTPFTPIGQSGFSVARHRIQGGVHTMTSTSNFGIVVYGYGSYTSYMYPGGLNLEKIVIVPE